jgi:hypothetical protein
MTEAEPTQPEIAQPEPDAGAGADPADAPGFDRVAELFLALTNRRVDRRGRLRIGVPVRELAAAFGEEARLYEALQALAPRLAGLGLEQVEYDCDGEAWLCLRSLHAAPPELDDTLMGVLGTIIMLVERPRRDEAGDPDGEADAEPDPSPRARPQRRGGRSTGPAPSVPTTAVADLLVGGGMGRYLSRSRFDDAVKRLDAAGYIVRSGRKISYGPRLLVEFLDDARRNIAEQAARLVT